MSSSGESSTPPAHLELGYVARVHGLHGELAVRTFDPASTTLEHLTRVLVRSRSGSAQEHQIVSVRPAAKETLVTLAGIASRTAAEAFRGATLLVFREDLPPAEEGEYFLGDLVGLAAVGESGEPLGKVEAVWETGPVPNLVIRRPDGEELLVPFADPFVPEVDVEAGRLVVLPPEYQE